MTTESVQEDRDHKAELVKIHTDWSAITTRFGAERTLMAAVRTSLSLIGFGFTIYKFFESLRSSSGNAGPFREYAPRRVGLTLVSLGLFVLVAATFQHWVFLKELQKESQQKFPRSVSLISALVLMLTGVVLLLTILLRL